MSLINQMLKDLDNRRGPASGAQAAALQGLGLGLASINHVRWQQGLPFAGWGLTLVLILIVGYQAFRWWIEQPQPLEASRPVVETVQAEKAVPSVAEQKPPEPATEAIVTGAETAVPDSAPKTADRIKPPSRESETTAVAHSAPVIRLTAKQKAERLFTRAQQALSGQRQQRGKLLLQQALDEYPGYTDARSQLATLLISEQDSGAAERLLAEGLAADPTSLELAQPYARLLAGRGALAPALETLQRAVGLHSAQPEALALRAAIYYRIGRHAESALDYQQALTLQPHQALWWTGLGVSLEHNGQSQQALEAYRRAAQLPLEEAAVRDYVQQRVRELGGTTAHY
jgi:Flp pilus assembly protein TadD